MFIGVLLVVIGVSSCRTQYVPMPSSHARDSVHSDLHKIVNNTIIRDSMAIRFATGIAIPSGIAGQAERSGISGSSPDTVFIDRWHIEIRDRVVENTDTLRIIARDSIPYPVEVIVPGDSPVPRVYRYSLWFVILFLLYWLFRIAKAVYLRR